MLPKIHYLGKKAQTKFAFFVQLMACFMKIYCRFVITVLYLINDIISLEVGWDIISAAVLTIMAVNPSIYQPKSQFSMCQIILEFSYIY